MQRTSPAVNRIIMLTVVSVSSLILAGCGRTASLTEPDVKLDPPIVIDDRVKPDAGQVIQGEPKQATYCPPKAVARVAKLAPDLYAWILQSRGAPCHLNRRTSNTASFPMAAEDFPTPGNTVGCDAEGCWKALPSFARSWAHSESSHAFSSAKPNAQQWVGTVRASQNVDTGDIKATLLAMEYGATSVQRFERRYDSAGHLLEDAHFFQNSVWFTTTNTWDGDKLVASRFVDSINGTGITETQWTYEGNRLVSAKSTHVESKHVGTVEFTYRATGELTTVTRHVDGHIWARQQWAFHDWLGFPTLKVSKTEFFPEHYENSFVVRGADTLEPLIGASVHSDWDAARPVPAMAGGCQLQPHSLTYGYPEADGVYALGWPTGDRPYGIDNDYGFKAAFDTGLDRWFGHDLVEGPYGRWSKDVPSVTGTIDYDLKGRMVGESVTTGDDSVRWTRNRTFSENQLVIDTRSLRNDDKQVMTELAFTHDSAGHLRTRTFHMNNVLVGRHTWTYEGADIAIHTIAQHGLLGPTFGSPFSFPTNLDSLPKDLPAAIVHERRYSDTGRTVSILRNDLQRETRVRDDAGRLLSRREPPSIETFEYQPWGALSSYASDWDGDAVLDLTLSYEAASDNRLLTRRWSYDSAHTGTDTFVYTCK